MPIVVFAFLFGLAIDYEVFILSRMREVYDQTGDTSTAVIEGIGRTGRLVTSAALILTLAFIAMSTAPLSFLKMLATGLAASFSAPCSFPRSYRCSGAGTGFSLPSRQGCSASALQAHSSELGLRTAAPRY